PGAYATDNTMNAMNIRNRALAMLVAALLSAPLARAQETNATSATNEPGDVVALVVSNMLSQADDLASTNELSATNELRQADETASTNDIAQSNSPSQTTARSPSQNRAASDVRSQADDRQT